ncbi:hypothetical protein [Halioglobus maricola]|uniref:hypothetical protein n=1 Tax=Halioglobus maricola TaxID=2601894 RepID=UPI00128B027B|nr:hypothetical protein [Halioglobus maricola]
MTGSGLASYNVAGHHYPLFVSLMAVSIALPAGDWNDSLVHLPTLLCGTALLLGCYGQCREFGISRRNALVGVYLLISIPLLAAHMSLAGQADIWMAGYVGLGLVCLLFAYVREDRRQLLLGLVMMLLALQVKREALIWLPLAVAVLGICWRPRLALAVFLSVLLLAILAGVSGITYVDIPGLGAVGVEGAMLRLPGIGVYRLSEFDLLDDYWDNFFVLGNWHLLWTLLAFTVIALPWLPCARTRTFLAAFYLSLASCLIVMFQFTSAGQWAEDWTAINRLPLQFLPLFVVAIMLIAQDFGAVTLRKPVVRDYIAPALGVVAMGLVLFCVVYLPGDGKASRPIFAQGSDMNIVVGAGSSNGQSSRVEEFANGVAIVSSGARLIDAGQYDLAKVTLSGNNRAEPAFFWRNGYSEQDLHSIWLPGPGEHWVDLSANSNWRDRVREFGVIFYADGGRSAQLESVELFSASTLLRAQKLVRDWRQPQYWTQSSLHFLRAGSSESAVSLPLLAAIILGAAFISHLLLRGNPVANPVLVLLALVVWLILDARWLENRVHQAMRTVDVQSLLSSRHLDTEGDRLAWTLVDGVKDKLALPPARILVMSEDPSMRFEMLRAKYHMLPAAAWVHEGDLATAPLRHMDQLLILRRHRAATDYLPLQADELLRRIENPGGQKATLIQDLPAAMLIDLPKNARVKRVFNE